MLLQCILSYFRQLPLLAVAAVTPQVQPIISTGIGSVQADVQHRLVQNDIPHLRVLQVISLLLRSVGKTGQVAVNEEDEMDYSLKMNKELPDDIRVLAWCTVPADFSARHAARLHQLCCYNKQLPSVVLMQALCSLCCVYHVCQQDQAGLVVQNVMQGSSRGLRHICLCLSWPCF